MLLPRHMARWNALIETRKGIRARTISDGNRYLEKRYGKAGEVKDGAEILDDKQKYFKSKG